MRASSSEKSCRMGMAAAFAVLIFAVSAPGARAPDSVANVSFDQDYDLFYQEQFHLLEPIAQETVPKAFHTIIQQWHLTGMRGLRHPLVVQIKDLPSDTLRRWQAAYVRAQGRGDDLRQTLVLDIGCYMQNPYEDVQLILTHEMAHVILMDVETGPQAAAIPAWFNEGLAQSVTREGRTRVVADVAEVRRSGISAVPCDLNGPVDEFAHGPFNASCYPEYYLAVQRLKQLGGPRAVERIIEGLHQGSTLEDLLPATVKLDWPQFKEDAERYTENVLSGARTIP